MIKDWSTWHHYVAVPLWYHHYYWPPHRPLNLSEIKTQLKLKIPVNTLLFHCRQHKKTSIYTYLYIQDQNVNVKAFKHMWPQYKPNFVVAISGVAKIRELSSTKVTARRTRGIFVSKWEHRITSSKLTAANRLTFNTSPNTWEGFFFTMVHNYVLSASLCAHLKMDTSFL
jgi:hypothetical protein